MALATSSSRMEIERRFFFYMAFAIFSTIVTGFGSQLVTRRVWFTDFPWQVHVHAIVFSSWIILFVLQSALIAEGRHVELHRRLGWAGAVIGSIMVPLGIAATFMAVARGSITGVFPLGLFLALDVLHIVGFGVLTFAALSLRRQAGWHKRLALCGTILLTAPALSRLFGILHLGGATPVAVIAALMLFIAAAMIFDAALWRRVHPAYWWGAGAVVAVELLVVPIGFSPPVVAFATALAGKSAP